MCFFKHEQVENWLGQANSETCLAKGQAGIQVFVEPCSYPSIPVSVPLLLAPAYYAFFVVAYFFHFFLLLPTNLGIPSSGHLFSSFLHTFCPLLSQAWFPFPCSSPLLHKPTTCKWDATCLTLIGMSPAS